MTPAFEIRANGADITALIADRLISLELVDKDGLEADTFALVLDNRDGRIALPEPGALLDFALGYEGGPLTPLGRHAVDRLGGSGPELTLEIGGAAADLTGEIRSPRTRAWRDTSVGEIAVTIARAYGLIPTVADAILRAPIAYVAQSAESDLHFLTRLARDAGAVAKPVGGHLVVTPRGQSQSGAAPVEIGVDRLARYDWSRGARDSYARVVAEWQDADGGELNEVAAGEGTPVKRLRHPFATAAEARAACQAQLDSAARGELRLSGELSGFAPDLSAGGELRIPGFVPDLGRDWYVATVTHRLAERLRTTFEATRAAP